MNVQNISSLISFKGATININALSDVHGHLEIADRAYSALLENDCFEKEEKGKANYLIVGGDFYISGDKKGFLTDPNKPLSMFQADLLNKLISEIKKISPKNITIFAPGNHELDGGEETFKKIVSKTDAHFIATNLDFKLSPLLNEEIEKDKITDSRIDFIDDDKDETKKHAILNITALPFNMKYYMGEPSMINFLDNVNKPQKRIASDEYQNSLDKISEKIKEFKEKYPSGVVILTCHTGANFAQKCAQMGGMDLILDAHMHENKEKIVNGIPIISLGQNFERLLNAKIIIDDDGNVKKEYKILNPKEKDLSEDNVITRFYNNLFKKDYKKIYEIKSSDPSIKKLSIDGIRCGQNHLANFVTDVILSEIQKYDETVELFALNASSIRGGFELKKGKNVSQFELLNCLNGIQKKQGDIFINEFVGKDLIRIILDNIIFNSIDEQKNPLFQYSGIKVQKDKMLEDWIENAQIENLYKYVIVEKTGKILEADKMYKMANTEKYFIKTKNPFIKSFSKKAVPLNKNVLDLFIDYFNNNDEIIYNPTIRFY